MQTDELIDQLSGGLEPVRAAAVMRVLGVGLAAGILGSTLLMMATIGVRHDFVEMLSGGAFWLKFVYTFVIAALGLRLVERLGRPGTDARLPLLFLAVPVATIMALMAMQMMPASDGARRVLIMGHSANVCTMLIAALALPLFVGLFWSLKQLAPTRLTQAGAAAGLLAGSASATVYAFHCTESAATFIAIWYTAGILLTTLMGAALGRWALRW
jgi:hypothetical protein